MSISVKCSHHIGEVWILKLIKWQVEKKNNSNLELGTVVTISLYITLGTNKRCEKWVTCLILLRVSSGHNFLLCTYLRWYTLLIIQQGFPGGLVIKNPSASVRYMGMKPGLVRLHMLPVSKPVFHTYWTPSDLYTLLHNKGSPHNEKPVYRTSSSPTCSTEDPAQPK